MTEEIKEVETETAKNTCLLCISKDFKKFLISTFGSFIGVFFALSLFWAVNKPVVPVYPYQFNPYFAAPMHHKMMKKCHKGDFKDHHKDFKHHKDVKPLPKPKVDD